MDGRMITERRKEKGLTQDALGVMLGISGKAVSKWERGLAQPDGAHMTQLIDLLGLPVEPAVEKKVEQAVEPAKPRTTFRSMVKKEFFRIFAISAMIAACVCYLMGTIPLGSTVVSLGFAAVLFCFATVIRGK